MFLTKSLTNFLTKLLLTNHFLNSQQDVERLKPHIVRSLANAELYCMALSHLYADPNFHNLNHWGIIQVSI
jgi:calmodulin-regulated spectrin-associated protein